jgi:hypothetical protein
MEEIESPEKCLFSAKQLDDLSNVVRDKLRQHVRM